MRTIEQAEIELREMEINLKSLQARENKYIRDIHKHENEIDDLKEDKRILMLAIEKLCSG